MMVTLVESRLDQLGRWILSENVNDAEVRSMTHLAGWELLIFGDIPLTPSVSQTTRGLCEATQAQIGASMVPNL